MPELIGHDQTRAALAKHTGSFALLGPSGVGRRLIVQEWIADRVTEPLDWRAHRHEAFQPGVTYTVDADTGKLPWEWMLRPLEEGRLQLAVTGRDLPAPVLSRLPVFRVGLLSEFEVNRVLQAVDRTLQPRQLIARLLGGSLDRLDLAVAATREVKTLDRVLVAGVYDGSTRFTDPRAALYALQAACGELISPHDLPFHPTGLERIPWPLAFQLLDVDPDQISEHEARNLLIRTLRSVCA